MKENNVLLGLVLDYLKVFSLDTFSERLLIQKKIYFAQKFGIDMGFRYSWYIHGPYCTSLTTSYYDLIPDGREQFNDYMLNTEAQNLLYKVEQLGTHSNKETSGLSDDEWFELLASIDFLKNDSSWQIDKSKTGIYQKLKMEKPQFNEKQFNLAWEVLCQNGLIEE